MGIIVNHGSTSSLGLLELTTYHCVNFFRNMAVGLQSILLIGYEGNGSFVSSL